MSSSDVSVSNAVPSLESGAVISNPNQILSTEELSVLNLRSNRQGLVQLAGHLAVMLVSGCLWATYPNHLLLAIPALILYGFSIAAMFAPMHESVHRTAFANNRLNDVVAFFAGLLSFYNSTFYRRYHKWHHRYTRIPDKDPELSDLRPNNWWEYLLETSGLLWWWGKLRTHFTVATGRLDNYPYIPETARDEVVRSVRLQLGVYASAIALSILFQQPWFFLYWLLPLAVGQHQYSHNADHSACPLLDVEYAFPRRTSSICIDSVSCFAHRPRKTAPSLCLCGIGLYTCQPYPDRQFRQECMMSRSPSCLILENFSLQCGIVLPQAELVYQTYGELASDRSNVILYH
jgi:Fatty acid desaturase